MWCKTTIISLFISYSINLIGSEGTSPPPLPPKRTQSLFLLDPVQDREMYLYAKELERLQYERDKNAIDNGRASASIPPYTVTPVATPMGGTPTEEDFITINVKRDSEFAFFATELEKRAKQREADGNDLTFEPIFDRYYKEIPEGKRLSIVHSNEASKETISNATTKENSIEAVAPSTVLDENGLPRERKKWSKHPSCAAVIFLVIGGLIGKFVLCS